MGNIRKGLESAQNDKGAPPYGGAPMLQTECIRDAFG